MATKTKSRTSNWYRYGSSLNDEDTTGNESGDISGFDLRSIVPFLSQARTLNEINEGYEDPNNTTGGGSAAIGMLLPYLKQAANANKLTSVSKGLDVAGKVLDPLDTGLEAGAAKIAKWMGTEKDSTKAAKDAIAKTALGYTLGTDKAEEIMPTAAKQNMVLGDEASKDTLFNSFIDRFLKGQGRTLISEGQGRSSIPSYVGDMVGDVLRSKIGASDNTMTPAQKMELFMKQDDYRKQQMAEQEKLGMGGKPIVQGGMAMPQVGQGGYTPMSAGFAQGQPSLTGRFSNLTPTGYQRKTPGLEVSPDVTRIQGLEDTALKNQMSTEQAISQKQALDPMELEQKRRQDEIALKQQVRMNKLAQKQQDATDQIQNRNKPLTVEEQNIVKASDRIKNRLESYKSAVEGGVAKSLVNQVATSRAVPYLLTKGNEKLQLLKSDIDNLKADIPFLRGGKALTAEESKRVDILLSPIGKNDKTILRDLKAFEREFALGEKLVSEGTRGSVGNIIKSVDSLQNIEKLSTDDLLKMYNEAK